MNIATNEGVFEVACNMKLKCSGVERGWMQVIDRDMDLDDNWPAQWCKITSPKKLCLKHAVGCVPTNFYVKGVNYEHICEQGKTYQKGHTDAFLYNSLN